MKQSEIKAGKTYTGKNANTKNRTVEVLGTFTEASSRPCPTAYNPNQTWVGYSVTQRCGPVKYYCTLIKFASWAREEVL